MDWLHHDFKNYCELKGIKLLRDDMRFITKRLCEIPWAEHRRVMREYVKIWLKELGEHQNQNEGRKKANEYLRGED